MTDHDAINLSMTVLYMTAMIVALAGNTLLIYIVWKKPETRNLTSFMFVNMAVADLLVAVFQMPGAITHLHVAMSGFLGVFVCRFIFYVFYVSTVASIFSLTVMAFDRYFAVVHPFRRSIWFRKPKIITPLIWTSSMAFMSIVPVAFKLGNGGKCWIEKSLIFPFFALFFFVGFLLPLVIISALYTVLAQKLWFHEVPVDHTVGRDQREQEIPMKRVIRMLIIVVVVFAVCWLPLHVYQMSEGVSHQTGGNGVRWQPYVIIYICIWFGQANSAINPWLYIGLNGRMKAAFKNMILCRHEEFIGRGHVTFTTTGRTSASSTMNSVLETRL